jgi:hypothetical protein
MSHRPLILAVDQAWTPDRWLALEDVFTLYARGLVDYTIGETAVTLRGGTNAKTGKQSILEVGSILVVNTKGHSTPYDWVPSVTRDLLMRRDRHLCAYCGQTFKDKDLTIEHVHPESRGGKLTWTNIVAACKPCNHRKADRTPEEARMPLLYVPYVPNRFEDLIVRNRSILADQMEFLAQRVPKHSRLV